ncbi:Abi family protein [Corynebacterium pseudodiphtheriticum]|uniref:Abi family protein n=2 Tax=Corynebacterium pseudodiphtheriticum TaxID=37637 RepID=UPI001EF6E62C|nr:Abi family protein [Corynebacterium pseudodiphtheriticum]MCG7251994.1 Abi family protein [Corynebacterium pseudodiphtheriticum]MDK4339644.1 Abi family protein [Corynebacterium pseudodiphtheriticum]MDK8546014.1 Abi family protein [Corynebacterium pseudodiphtheriticum]MDK8686197.1 Abi family protein [Corynebacterium pseudodiphtheriticum]MDK8718721.1 Abi family protein [Corynebacterium pseudodiphtheriticum]
MAKKSRRQAQRDQDILKRIGTDRMHPYLIEMQNNPGRALDLYRWNTELSSSFWPLISVTEVSLRNALDERLGQWCQNNGGHRDWLLYIAQAPSALKDEFGGKARTFRSKAEDAKEIRDKGTGLVTGSHPRKNATLTNGDILSQITLGEWGHFIPSAPRIRADGSKAPFPDPTTAQRRERLWNAVIRQAFLSNVEPHALAADLNRLRLFRNRIAHHEPIFVVEYRRHRNELLRLLGNVAPPVHQWYTSTDHLPEVFKNDPRESK